jgi:phospholipase D-like protein
MPLFWLIVTPIAIVVAAITLVDVFRRPHGGWLKAGWVVAVVVLPILGSLIYWATRRYSPDEAEEAYLAEADMRRESAHRSYDV